MDKIFVICVALTTMFMGYYVGKRDGLHQGAMELTVCNENGATGWYVVGNEFNCIF